MRIGLAVPRRVWHEVPSGAFVGVRSLKVEDDATAFHEPGVRVEFDSADLEAFVGALGLAVAACRMVEGLIWSAVGRRGGSNGS